MGMDVYGINPELKSEKPEIDWDTATDEQKDKYFEASAKWEAENPGVYFRNTLVTTTTDMRLTQSNARSLLSVWNFF